MAWNTSLTPPPGMGIASLTNWLDTNRSAIKSSWTAANNEWTNKIGATKDQLASTQNAWSPITWQGSPWESRYNTQEQGMDALLGRIQNYGGSTDMAAANDMVAQSYGMTPEQYAAIQAENTKRMTDQNYAAQSDASAATAYLETISTSAFAQEQEKATRVAMRQAEEAIGKQLESVFGERGGMGGFQAAYELTSQLQSSYLQQQTQEHLSMFNQAVASVNAQNGYFQNLIQQGALSAKDYLSMRFDQLQTGYQDYLSAMSETRSQWETIEAVDERQREAAEANLQQQIDNMTTQMTLEMGGYTNAEEYYAAISEEYMQGPLAQQALADEKQEQNTATGTALLTTGATIAGAGVTYAATTAGAAAIAAGGAAAAIPVVGWVIGGALLLVGLGFLIFGGGGGGGGTSVPATKVNPGADRH